MQLDYIGEGTLKIGDQDPGALVERLGLGEVDDLSLARFKSIQQRQEL